MKILLIYLFLFAGQMNTLQSKPIVRLPSHQNFIPLELDGDVVELKSPPPTVRLPDPLPVQGTHGDPWVVVVRNLGPGTVTIVGRAQFSVRLSLGQTVQIKATKTGYSAAR